jgi:hypothetical protein
MKSSDIITPATNPAGRLLRVLTTPSVHVSALMTTILIFCTYTLCNAVLLSGFFTPSSACFFWNKTSCSADDTWILRWFALAKFHVVILVGSLAASSTGMAWLETKIGILCSAIILGQLAAGMACLPHLNTAMTIFQAIILVTLLLVLLFWILHQPELPVQPDTAPLLLRSSQSPQDWPVPTLTLGLQLVLSMIQLADMTMRPVNEFLGDVSRYVVDLQSIACLFRSILVLTCVFHFGFFPSFFSPTFQSIAYLTTIDRMMVPLTLIAVLFVGNVTQQNAVLTGQAVSLFVNMTFLFLVQGNQMDPNHVKVIITANFISMAMSVLGADGILRLGT